MSKKNLVTIPSSVLDRVCRLQPWVEGQALAGTSTTRSVLLHALALGLAQMEHAFANAERLPMPDHPIPLPIPTSTFPPLSDDDGE